MRPNNSNLSMRHWSSGLRIQSLGFVCVGLGGCGSVGLELRVHGFGVCLMLCGSSGNYSPALGLSGVWGLDFQFRV